MSTINLKEILSNEQFRYFDETRFNSLFSTEEKEIVINAMRKACEKTVELCAENFLEEGTGHKAILKTRTQIT